MMRRRVLHLIDTGGPGGAETIFLNLVTGLDKDRWESIAVIPERDWLYDALRANGIEPLILATRCSFDVWYTRQLYDLIKGERISIVQSHLLTSAVYGSIAGRLGHVPVVCTFHGTADLPAHERFRRAKIEVLDREMNRVVFVSNSLRRAFERMMPLRRARSDVVWNGIDAAAFRGVPDDALRVEFGVPAGHLLIGAIGNVRASKAYDVLLRAAAALKALAVPFRLIIVGDTRSPLFGQLIALRRDLGLDADVTFAGFREDITRFFNTLDVFVLSSSAEGFSLSTIQALASGVPVVATRCGGPEDIIEHAVTGQLVENGNADALAHAIRNAAIDRDFVRRTTEAGMKMVGERFTRAAMVRSYEAIYDACLGERAAQNASAADSKRAKAGARV